MAADDPNKKPPPGESAGGGPSSAKPRRSDSAAVTVPAKDSQAGVFTVPAPPSWDSLRGELVVHEGPPAPLEEAIEEADGDTEVHMRATIDALAAQHDGDTDVHDTTKARMEALAAEHDGDTDVRDVSLDGTTAVRDEIEGTTMVRDGARPPAPAQAPLRRTPLPPPSARSASTPLPPPPARSASTPLPPPPARSASTPPQARAPGPPPLAIHIPLTSLGRALPVPPPPSSQGTDEDFWSRDTSEHPKVMIRETAALPLVRLADGTTAAAMSASGAPTRDAPPNWPPPRESVPRPPWAAAKAEAEMEALRAENRRLRTRVRTTTAVTAVSLLGAGVVALLYVQQSRRMPAVEPASIEQPAKPAVPLRQGFEAKSTEQGVRVFVDGSERGTLPLVVDDLTPGPHRVRFERANGRGSTERVVEVAPGAVTDLGTVELPAP